MTTARDLVNAIQSGKSATIQATFDSLMAEKVQLGIEAYRQAVIDNTFNPELVSESTEEDESSMDSSIDEEFQQESIRSYFKTAGKRAISAKEFVDTHGVDVAKKHLHAIRAEAKQNIGAGKWNMQHDQIARGLHHAIKSSMDSSIDESEEFDLSEFTLEEIQDFMDSEEFSALDELSKSTLASYVKKASGNMASATRAAGVEAGARGPNRYARMADKENRAQKRSNGISKAVDKLAKG